jgi:SAM-dependent methyltransferase
MVEQLRANARGAPPAVLLADARSLPFVTGSFGAILASHVLHLLADWTRAVDEAFRVLRPRGCFLVDFGGGAEAPWGKLAHAILDGYGVHRVRPGASHVEPVADYLTRRAVSRPLPPLRLAVHRSLARDLRDWEEQIYSWTWPYPAEQMARACAAVRVEAERQSIDVDEVVELERVIQWWAFDRVPGGP